MKYETPLKLQDLKIADTILKRQPYVKFFRAKLGQNISWKDHIKIVENKLSNYTGLFDHAKQIIDDAS